MDKNNKIPLSDEQQAEQQIPVGDTQPFEHTPGEDRTIAFEAGSQGSTDSVDDILEDDTMAGWEEETVAVNVEDPGSDEEEQPADEDAPDEAKPEEDVMPPLKRRNPFKRVPKRVYHRGRLFSLAYVLVTVTMCVFASVMFLRVFNDVLAFITDNRAITINIDESDTTDDVAAKLKDAGLIKYDWLFSYVAKFEGTVAPYEPGEHTLNDNMNYMELLNEIEKKKTVRETVQITFIEGLDIDEIAALLEENNVCDADDFIKEVGSGSDYGFDFEDEISHSSDIFYPLEGYLFPDTYEFYTNSAPADVIVKMMGNFQNKIDTVQELMTEMGLTQHQTITLASIIQAEASGDPENMKLVSSVYWNRLNDAENYPMLQSDPTRDYANSVILMAGKNSENQRKASLYNTYECTGLPAGPICNPGMDAIMAALQPESTAYYYFCSNTKTGEFYYAETLQAHEQNVDQIN